MTQLIDLGKLRFHFAGNWQSGVTYERNDIVKYGGNVYVYTYALSTNTHLPTDTTYWALMVEGFKFVGEWSSSTAYKIGDGITHGGKVYIANTDNQAQIPPNTDYWAAFADGVQYEGAYNAATTYQKNDIVVYGNTVYLATDNTTGNLPTDTNYWDTLINGITYKSEWVTATSYNVDDVVKDGISTYICLVQHTAGANFLNDVALNYWEFFARGADDVLPPHASTDAGKSLTVSADGVNYEWLATTGSNNVFYVAPHGVDSVTSGKSISTPYASIKFASTQAPANSVIYVKNGTYNEQLPITVKDTQAIIGDTQRNVIVQPASGNSDDGSTPNNEAEMFRLSNGSILRNLTLKGMTGWVPAASPNASSLATSTPKGVGVCLNPASPVTTKSPYVIDCTAIGSGMVGAYVNGSAHSSGNTSMLFHGYTVISDNGVGFWIANGARAELVSCFTYYCYFGYGADHGAKVRALNGNNSYGEWGSVSEGYDQSESPLAGAVAGQRLNVSDISGNWVAGDVVQGVSASAVLTNVQEAAGYFYVKNVTGTFTNNDTLVKGSTAINTGWYIVETAGVEEFYFQTSDIVSTAASKPALTLERGKTYTFTLASGEFGHELGFKNGGVVYTDGVTFGTSPAAGTGGHVITFAVPQDAPDTLTYYDSGSTGDGDAAGNTITIIANNSTAIVDVDELEDQKGFTIIADGFNETPKPGRSIQFSGDSDAYVIQSVSGTYVDLNSEMIIILAQEKATGSADNQGITIREGYSQIRLTGHDFLSIGTGGITTTNYPGEPTQASQQGNEINETKPGRVYYVSTDQDGNFRVGEYFKIDQATGTATLNANAFDLAGLTSLRLGSIGAQLGEQINEFSSDVTLSGSSNSAVPTENATKTYVDNSIKTQVITPASNNLTLQLGRIYAVDGAHTLTLPASPSVGDTVKVLDISGTASSGNITIARNGNKIGNLTEDFLIDVDNASVNLVYINSTYGWGVL
ncbi:pectinesterase family protein [Amylibacter sp.]|nr:pectinesterase family protein [Amylibacter sp.]